MTEYRSERLVLRRFTPADGPALHAYLSRPEAVAFEPYGTITASQADAWAATRTDDPSFWAVCLGATATNCTEEGESGPNSARGSRIACNSSQGGPLIGNLYLARVPPDAWCTWELGYVFNPDHWGHGYATEAAARLIDVAFTRWGAHRVLARCDPRNPASWRLLERLGFRREGHLLANASFRNDAAGNPIWKDTYLYAILANEWCTDLRESVRRATL